MKTTLSIPKKRAVLALGVVLLMALLPLAAAAAAGIAGGGAGARADVSAAALDLSLTASRDATGVTAVLKSSAAEDSSASLILAVYGPDGRMEYFKTYPITAGAGATMAQRFDYDVAAHPNYIYKVFAWDSASFAPLSKDVSSARCITIDGADAAYDGSAFVNGDAGVTEFSYVKLDEMTKRGAAYTATKSSAGKWAHARAYDIDVVIATKPAEQIGGALPDIEVSALPTPNGRSSKRVIISL